MILKTLSIDKKRNLIIQYPVFVQPYTQQQLISYQLEIVAVPVKDKNTKADTYTQLQIKKSYIANTKAYINIRQQELAICKKIAYEFY